jgi:Tol biopolymer transport system component
MRFFSIAGVALCIAASQAHAQPATQRLGLFERSADIGETALPGTALLNGEKYRLSGSGANIWGEADAFHYVWTERSGDLHISAEIAFDGQGVDPHRKAGVMIRQNRSAGSPYADVMVHGDGLISMQYREAQDGPTREIVSNLKAASARVRLEREGDYIWFSVAEAGKPLRHAGGNFRIPFQAPYLAGLAISSHNNAVRESATFSNVSITVPKLSYVPDTGYAARVEATLETMDVADVQSRRVVRHFPGKIEAPNWTRDGRALIYNADGKIWRIPTTGGEPVQVNTGRHLKNNNDHGISPDGKQLVISDQSEPDDFSRIYTLPMGGSDKPVLRVGHPDARSYWHGWSPDGKTLAYVYVHATNGKAEIWARDLATGKDKALIAGPGTSDGPEWSPDGKHLWFNSARSGAMQIWRANADGSGPVQITTDPDYRDWFPHISPDGKWVAFISFGLDIALGDHPPNRDVVLRLMPTDGSSPPRVLTRLFGGQGTLNVPSWSPDSKQIAFVSYRLVR